MRDVARRLVEMEKRQPRALRRVVIIGQHDPEPADADFIIRIVPAPFSGDAHT